MDGKRVTVILPCKGIDPGLEKHLEALKNQSYKNYRLVAVIDGEHDPVHELLIKNEIQVILSKDYGGSGKVNAIATAMDYFKQNTDIFVVVDSDTMVSSNWLSYLVTPIIKGEFSAVSTYPEYIPAEGKKFWNYVKRVWGMLGINMMEFPLSRFVWGGSMAFSSDIIFPENFNTFCKSVSDDASITGICSENNFKIGYSKKATPEVHVSEDRKKFMEWSTRQMAISVNYSKMAFISGMFIYTGTILFLFSLIPLSIYVSDIFVIGYIPWLVSTLINVRREKENRLMVFFVSLIISFVYFWNLLSGIRKKTIEWRGKEYKLS
ncbi:glycosyltransferase [Caldiplasma sukawensis]